jgi:hypothetical protein
MFTVNRASVLERSRRGLALRKHDENEKESAKIKCPHCLPTGRNQPSSGSLLVMNDRGGLPSSSETACLRLSRHIAARFQRLCFVCPSLSCTFQAECEAEEGGDNDAEHECAKDCDGKRRAKLPRMERDRNRYRILNGRNDNGCYNENCYAQNEHNSISSFIRVGRFCHSSGHARRAAAGITLKTLHISQRNI